MLNPRALNQGTTLCYQFIKPDSNLPDSVHDVDDDCGELSRQGFCDDVARGRPRENLDLARSVEYNVGGRGWEGQGGASHTCTS